MKRLRVTVFGLFLGASALAVPLACSTKVPLAQINALCEYDEQCAQGLACKCVRRRNPDEEGPDEILKPGVCQTAAYRCAGDAGVADTAPEDTALTDALTDTGAPDAADGG